MDPNQYPELVCNIDVADHPAAITGETNRYVRLRLRLDGDYGGLEATADGILRIDSEVAGAARGF
jgi:hypothetical protein